MHSRRFRQDHLLTDRASKARSRVGWLFLDPEDNDPVRFFRYIVGALHRAGGLDERIRALFTDLLAASSRMVILVELRKSPSAVTISAASRSSIVSPCMQTRYRSRRRA